MFCPRRKFAHPASKNVNSWTFPAIFRNVAGRVPATSIPRFFRKATRPTNRPAIAGRSGAVRDFPVSHKSVRILQSLPGAARQRPRNYLKTRLHRHPGEPRTQSGAGAGVQNPSKTLDSGFRRNDDQPRLSHRKLNKECRISKFSRHCRSSIFDVRYSIFHIFLARF
jgi:hypothetical protein